MNSKPYHPRDRGRTDKIYPGQGLFDSSFQISEDFQVRAELDLFVIPPEDRYQQMKLTSEVVGFRALRMLTASLNEHLVRML